MQKTREVSFQNEHIINSFSKEEKDILFTDLMNMYFKKNFGTKSKTDLETYLFSFYLEHLLDNEEEFDDYTLGRDLGITLAKVRSLKERKELIYPREGFDWKKSFLHYAENAKYDENKRLIKFSIPDVNVIKEARYFFEKNGYYDEYQLNPKLFQCPLEAFEKMGQLIAKAEGEEQGYVIDEKQIKNLTKVKCSDKDKSIINKLLTGVTEDGLKDLLTNGTKEIMLVVLESFVPGGAVAAQVLKIITNILKR